MTTPTNQRAKHTPVPWKLVEDLDIVSDCEQSINVATCGTSITEFYETAIANAALIVKAVNERKELVDALRDCLDALYNETHDYPDSPWIKSVKDKASAALKQAEGD